MMKISKIINFGKIYYHEDQQEDQLRKKNIIKISKVITRGH